MPFPSYLCEDCHAGLIQWTEKTNNSLDLKESLLQLPHRLNPEWAVVLQERLIFARALLPFDKKNATASLIHALKYYRNVQLGFLLGEHCGKMISHENKNIVFDAILPIPLHWRKKFSRGYNQSEYIAKGIEKVTGAPLQTRVLKRHRFTRSQAKKSQTERLKLKAVFSLRDPKKVCNKTVLLVDDVMATGTTLWQALLPIIEAGAKSVGIMVASASLEQRTQTPNPTHPLPHPTRLR